MRRLTRREFLTLATVATSATVGFGVGAAQAQRFGINQHRVVLPGLKSALRVVQLSDLHIGPFYQASHLAAWVKATQAQRPDLVVITGDVLDGNTSLEQMQQLGVGLARLHAPLGVYATLGNHDYDAKHWLPAAHDMVAALPTLQRELNDNNIRLLINAGRQVREDLFLVGLDDLGKGQPNIGAALASAPTTGAVLALSHNPDLLPEMPARVGLTLCGHTHGGQIRLPLVGAPFNPSQRGYIAGFSRNPGLGFVSRGLGTTGINVRIGAPAEMVVFELVPQ